MQVDPSSLASMDKGLTRAAPKKLLDLDEILEHVVLELRSGRLIECLLPP